MIYPRTWRQSHRRGPRRTARGRERGRGHVRQLQQFLSGFDDLGAAAGTCQNKSADTEQTACELWFLTTCQRGIINTLIDQSVNIAKKRCLGHRVGVLGVRRNPLGGQDLELALRPGRGRGVTARAGLELQHFQQSDGLVSVCPDRFRVAPGNLLHPDHGLAVGCPGGIEIAPALGQIAEVLIGEGQAAAGILIGGVGIDGGLAVAAKGGQPSFRLIQLPERETRHPEVVQGEAELPEIGDILGIDHAEGPGICQHFAIHRNRLGGTPSSCGDAGEAALD